MSIKNLPASAVLLLFMNLVVCVFFFFCILVSFPVFPVALQDLNAEQFAECQKISASPACAATNTFMFVAPTCRGC